MRCDPLWKWEAKPRDFRCSICFKPGALLLGGSMVPNSLVPMGLRSTSPCSHGLSGRPQGGLCANAAQASVRPCEPQCWPEQPRAPRFPRGHADCHPTAPTLYLRDSVVNTACLQQGLPIDKVGLHEWREPGSIPQCWHWAARMQEAPNSQFTRNSSFFQGDSGGPLVCEFDRTWVQIGVVSWGQGCAYPMYPTVFARVSFFSKWIHHHIENTPLPLQPLPALSSTLGAIISVLMTSLAAPSML